MCNWNTGISVQSKPVLTNYNVIPEARGGEHGEGGAPENCGQGGEHGRRSRRPQVQLHWELSEHQVQLQKGVKATPAATTRGAVQMSMRSSVEINHRQRNT